MVDRVAQSVRTAYGCDAAGIATALINAALIGRTVLVDATADGAHAIQTDVTEEAVVIQSARQHAVSANAFLIQGTLVVGVAFWNAATFQTTAAGVAFVTALTGGGDTDAFLLGRTGETFWTEASPHVVLYAA